MAAKIYTLIYKKYNFSTKDDPTKSICSANKDFMKAVEDNKLKLWGNSNTMATAVADDIVEVIVRALVDCTPLEVEHERKTKESVPRK
jgi:hypothetical protein